MKLSDIRKFQQSFPSPEAVSTLQHHQQLLKELGLEPGSFYQELEMDSPFVDTHQEITSSNSQLQFHSHTFYEMLCCRNT